MSTPGQAHRAGLGRALPARRRGPPPQEQVRPQLRQAGDTSHRVRLDSPTGLATRLHSARKAGVVFTWVNQTPGTTCRPSPRARVDTRGGRPRVRGLPNDRAPISISNALMGSLPVRDPKRNRIALARRGIGPAMREPSIATVAVPIQASIALVRQASEDLLPVAPRREETRRARGRSRGPESDGRACGSKGREVSRPRATELRAAEKETDPIRVVDNIRVIKITYGPGAVHRSDGGPVPQVDVIDDPHGQLGLYTVDFLNFIVIFWAETLAH